MNEFAPEGEDAYRIVQDLYPIPRSLTGNGVRRSLEYLQNHVPLVVHEVPTGTRVFDWEIPKEWNIREAWIKNAAGAKMVDWSQSNLHVVGYSVPVHAKMTGTELKAHLHSIPEHPDWIPYRTSYYKETWGFCVPHRTLLQLNADEEYEVLIDSSLAPGHLTYGEYRIQGLLDDEVLISTHCCHPALANDNLSGVAVATQLARLLGSLNDLRIGHRDQELQLLSSAPSGGEGARRAGEEAPSVMESKPLRYTYRFLWIPGTIGAITWLATHDASRVESEEPSPKLPQSRSAGDAQAPWTLDRIKHGLVLSCLGDSGPFHYKRSRRANAEMDRVVERVLEETGSPHEILPFSPVGYDERQFCSPGINLPVGCLMRTPNGCYPEYHTSADNLNLVSAQSLAGSIRTLFAIVQALERNRTYVNLHPKGEPQLGRRGLYGLAGGLRRSSEEEKATLWLLNYSDGKHSLLDIASVSGFSLEMLSGCASVLEAHGLLRCLG